MKQKENQRVALTRRLLKESLLELLEKKPIQKITVSELCAAAQINRSTFYSHYGCPADVVQEITADMIDEITQLREKEAPSAAWPINKLMEMLCNYLWEHKRVVRQLLRANDTNAEFASQVLQAARIRLVSETFFDRTQDEESQQLVLTFLIAGAYYMLRRWILEDMQKTPREMGDMVMNLASRERDSLWPEER